MSIRAMEAVERQPGEAFTTAGERFVLYMLANLADEADSCHPEIAWLQGKTSQSYSAVQRHLASLQADGWIGRERIINEDGTRGGYRFFLSGEGLEKLGLPNIHRSNRPVDEASAEPVDNDDASTGRFAQSTGRSEKTTGRFAETTGQIDRSLKEAFLPSFPSSLVFSDEEERLAITRVVEVSGPGLADYTRHRRVLESLQRVLPNWIRAYDFELDVLPTIAARTKATRKTPVYDFALFEPDLRAHRLARLPGPRAKAPPVVDDETRLTHLEADRLRVEQGRPPLFVVANGETRDDLLARIDAERRELEDRRRVKA